ncbi:uncharacterized protein LOC126977916 [Leptidea sinapis]|uniref:uncharacterized protein LOC126977916 n=1 Tax=Leptidea sinapis TaxID=189913 RepID=UPI0021C3E1E2|nr:uncharacterized protein LOC126977916 [Leptidea sinapis]
MRFLFWVTALAVLSLSYAKNSTTKTKPKRQLDNIRTPQNLQYSLVLPHSRVSHFRSISSSRRISNGSPRGRLPPYAVQMEPVVQYSQKDPLYDPKLDNYDDAVLHKNDIAQSKILNINDQSAEGSYGPPYGSLPTAPLYSNEHSHYIEAPEPIIEIIIKESNESLPAPPPALIQKKKKEPVQVFYVKYSKDPHSHDKVIYEKPIPAITPPSNDEDDHHDYVTVTPEPYYVPPQTTTLRAIIKPESEIYHTDSNVKVTFGNEGRHYTYNRREESPTEGHEETAPRPAIALPNSQPTQIPLERSISSNSQYQDHSQRIVQSSSQTYQPVQGNQNRFQQPYLNHENTLPRQRPPIVQFKSETPTHRQNTFGPQTSPNRAVFSNTPPTSNNHYSNTGPPIPGPIGPILPTLSRPNSPPSFHTRSNNQFSQRQHFNSPSRTTFHSGPQRPIHSQPQPYFDEAKYLQENYHTITTDNVEPSKQQLLPAKQTQTFNLGAKASNQNSNPIIFNDRPHSLIPYNQQLPLQRPSQHFDSSNRVTFGAAPTRPTFFNLKPSPPQIDNNRPPFNRQPQQQFSFHQGPQNVPRPSNPDHNQNSFSAHNVVSPSPSPIPQTQFLPQPSSPPLFSFHPQPSSPPQQSGFQSSERPLNQDNLHQQHISQFIPQNGELVPAVSKYEQHITVSDPTAQPNYSGFSGFQASTNPSQPQLQFSQQQLQQQIRIEQQQQEAQTQQRQHEAHLQQQHQQAQLQQRQHDANIQHQQQQQAQLQQHQQQARLQQQQQSQQEQQTRSESQQQYVDAEQEQVRQQLAQNVRKQQEEINRLQNQLAHAQQQHQQYQNNQYENQYSQQQSNSPQTQYVQERSRPQSNYVTSTPASPYYQSTARTVEIKPTPKYISSSTANSISTTPAPKRDEKKKPTIELPDEVPDDLRQQLLSSGILDNADISVLDYDKVGETPLESLPPDQLANFFSAGGGQQIAASEHKPIVVAPNGDQIESRIDEDSDSDDQDLSASENVETYAELPENKDVEMKVVHFDPHSAEGQKIASDYVKEDATQVDPVALNDKKYNRYLPLKVSGNQFPIPDIVKGRKVTSVVVLAPVETENLSKDHTREERATRDGLRGIKFIAGDSLHKLLNQPSRDNFKKWLDVEKKTVTDQQSVVLLVTESEDPKEEREIFMYDISSGSVNKLNGELSNAFVEAAENNSLSKDIEKLAIEGDGTPEDFRKDKSDIEADGSENVPLFVDISGLSLDQESSQVSITSGYSKTKHGRELRRRI